MTEPNTRTDAVSVRFERSIGLDEFEYGVWRDGRHTVVNEDIATIILVEHGMTRDGAAALLAMVADEDAAFEVRNGTTELL